MEEVLRNLVLSFHFGGPREPTEYLHPLIHLGGALVDFQLLIAMAYYNKSCLAKEHIVCIYIYSHATVSR